MCDLEKLADLSGITISSWVPDYSDIAGNVLADKLARRGYLIEASKIDGTLFPPLGL